MAYTPYYAPYSRPTGYYNPSIPQQDMSNMQNPQQMPVQQPIQQMTMQTPTQFIQAQPTNDMLFVLNENEASAYPVAPNNSVVLWDKNNKTFYLKTANAQGVPSMQIYDFTERIENPSKTPTEHVCKCGDNFVTKDDFNALKGDFEALSKRFEETAVTQVTKPNKTTKKGE